MKILKKVKIKNFLSHKDTVIEFKDNCKMLIDGMSGSGKSTIFDAITWCLYANGRVENKNLIHKGAEKAEVSITIIDSELNKEYKITRSITEKNKHDVVIKEIIDGKETSPVAINGIKENQNFIEHDIIGASYLLFVNSVCHPQNDVENFAQQTASKRKDIIMEIIRANDYDDYLKIAKEQLSSLKTKIEVIEARIEEKNNFIANNSLEIIGIESIKEKIDTLKKRYEEILSSIETVSKSKEEIFSKLGEINSLSSILISYQENIEKQNLMLEKSNKELLALEMVDIASLEKDVEKLKETKIKLKEEDDKKELLFKYNNDLASINSEIPVSRDFDGEIFKINKKIKELSEQKIVTCQKCGTPLSYFQDIKDKQLAKLNKDLEYQVSQKNGYDEQREVIVEKIEKLGEKPLVDFNLISSLKSEIDSLSSSESKLNEIKQNKTILVAKYSDDISKASKQIKEDEAKIAEIAVKITGKEKLEKELSEIESKVYSLNSEKTSINSELSEKQAKLLYLENLLSSIDKSKEEVAVLKADANKFTEDIESLNLMKEVFGPNGIKAIMIDFLIPQLEDHINNILSKLSDFRINLETQKSSLGGESNIEGLFINIVDSEGNERDFNSYSGGEKGKCSAAIFEGLAKIQGNIGFRILDEVASGLDEKSIGSFADVIISLKENTAQIFCISHLQPIKDLFVEKIEVRKINGVSSIIF
jgi:exonuclease SbcC